MCLTWKRSEAISFLKFTTRLPVKVNPSGENYGMEAWNRIKNAEGAVGTDVLPSFSKEKITWIGFSLNGRRILLPRQHSPDSAKQLHCPHSRFRRQGWWICNAIFFNATSGVPWVQEIHICCICCRRTLLFRGVANKTRKRSHSTLWICNFLYNFPYIIFFIFLV